MSKMKVLFVVLASITVFSSPCLAMDLEDELIETEALLNDSEAAQEYSEETAIIMAKENKLAQMKSALQTSAGDGMQTLDQSLQKLVALGHISREVAMKKADNPNTLFDR